ncbi:MAG: 4Fe-4S binding protein [Gemmatimonadota bacterium]|nr:4Fe-4S binding protein [Gemmatimonadota bacterium]
MKFDRRDFLKKGAAVFLAGCSAQGLALLTGCTKNDGFSPFTGLEIDSSACVGCGACKEECESFAIVLPKPTLYTINTEKCTSCGDCKKVCEMNAIRIGGNYSLNQQKCVGCGKCLDVCLDDALSWESRYYTVRNSCRPNRCGRPCAAVCQEKAITFSSGIMVINHDLCTRCGKCVGVCPYAAIDPARVKMDDSKCTNCGKCFEVCEFDSIVIDENDGTDEPVIDPALCSRCGLCVPECREDALEVEHHTASIDQTNCTQCGMCFEVCSYNAIKSL